MNSGLLLRNVKRVLVVAISALAGVLLFSCSSHKTPAEVSAASSDFRPAGSTISRTLFGLNIHALVFQKEPWPAIPFGSLRLWDSATGWAQLNPSKGEYDWGLLDQWLAAASQRDNQIEDILYTFGRTPQFASSQPGRDCGYGPGQCAAPSDLTADGNGSDQYWKDFVTAIVTHSKNSRTAHIKYWELWNEPYSLNMWAGTVPQMVRMAQDAYSIIKNIDPNAVVVAPCIGINVPAGNKWLNWYDAYLSAGGGNYADIMSVHGYVHYGGRQPGAQAFLDYYRQAREIMTKHGLAAKPVWDTEASWGETKDNHFENQDDQAAFVAQFYLLQWSQGLQRLYWYAYNGQSADSIGALWIEDSDRSGHLTKAGKAFVQTQEWLVGATFSEPCQQDGSRFVCNLTRNGHPGQIVWDSAGSSYSPKGTFAKMSDLDGNTRAASAQVQIGAKPVLLETQ